MPEPSSIPLNGLRIDVAAWLRVPTTSTSPGMTAQPPASRIWSTRLYGVDVKKNCSARVTSSAMLSANGCSRSRS